MYILKFMLCYKKEAVIKNYCLDFHLLPENTVRETPLPRQIFGTH